MLCATHGWAMAVVALKFGELDTAKMYWLGIESPAFVPFNCSVLLTPLAFTHLAIASLCVSSRAASSVSFFPLLVAAAFKPVWLHTMQAPLFVSGSVHAKHWREAQGVLVGICNPTLMDVRTEPYSFCCQ